MKHTILGAGGTIARELSKNLAESNINIRQVGRNPVKINPSDELVKADLLNYKEVETAVAGSDVVYLTAGLPYKVKTWQTLWPIVMKNTLDACKKNNCKLVFFDNVYAYGKVEGKMTEETPFNPISKKGEVRAKIATMLLDEIKAGNLTGMIVRGADFYGPGVELSLTYSMVTNQLKKGKAPQWFGDPTKVHTFTYTPDAGRSLALLALGQDTFNQTWHALSSPEELTGLAYIEMASAYANQPVRKPQVLGKGMLTIIGLFVPVLGEFREMLYQYESDYRFDSSKIIQKFGVQPTTYQEGIKITTLY